MDEIGRGIEEQYCFKKSETPADSQSITSIDITLWKMYERNHWASSETETKKHNIVFKMYFRLLC